MGYACGLLSNGQGRLAFRGEDAYALTRGESISDWTVEFKDFGKIAESAAASHVRLNRSLSAATGVDLQLGEDRNCTVSVAVLID